MILKRVTELNSTIMVKSLTVEREKEDRDRPYVYPGDTPSAQTRTYPGGRAPFAIPVGFGLGRTATD